jgi:CelD/BcsL family acetyltransferase involved in cellulose biosynthesis
MVGPLPVFARSVRMYEAFAAPLATGTGASATVRELLRSMLARLRADLEPDAVLLFSAVAEGSVLHEMLSPGAAQADGFESVQHGPFYPHRIARVTDDYEGYLKSLGSRTRADLRTTRKKFLAQGPAVVRTRRFTRPAEIDEFVRDAMEVSRTTWQFRHLQAGLHDADTLTRQYRAMAALGWFRSYVVYVGERPVAFQVGHVFRDVYYAQDTGYDPQWARLSAGNFQHTEIMMDLAGDGAIRVLDFGGGDFSHKQRLATDAMPLGYFHLIPATPGGRFLAASLRTANEVSQSLGTWLERLGLHDRSKRLSRSGLARRS